MPAVPYPAPAEVRRTAIQPGAPESTATGEAFGAGVGRAIAGLGGAIQGFGAAIGEYGAQAQAKKDTLDTASWSANHTYTTEYNKQAIEYDPASGDDFVPSLSSNYDQWMEKDLADFAKTGASQKAIDARRLDLLQKKDNYITNGANHETKAKAEHSKSLMDTGLANLQNEVRNNGQTSEADFKVAEDDGVKLIEAQVDLPADIKEDRKKSYSSDLAVARFEGMMAAADTKAELLALKAELDKPFWKNRMEGSAYDTLSGRVLTAADNWSKLSIDSQNDTHLNSIRADPTKYDTEIAAAVKDIEGDTGLTGIDKASKLATVKSDAVFARFEGLAVKATTTQEIDKLQEELNQPKYRDVMTKEAYAAEVLNLTQYENALIVKQDRVRAGIEKKIGTVDEKEKSAFVAQTGAYKVYAGKRLIPDSDMRAYQQQLFKFVADGGVLTDEQVNNAKEIVVAQDEYRKSKGLTPAGYRARANEIVNGNGRGPAVKWSRGFGGAPQYTAPNGVVVRAAISDQTSLQGMQPRAYVILNGMIEAAGANGVTELIITAGKGGGHKSHGDGTEWDLRGRVKGADGKMHPWSTAQRAAVARGGAGASANRFGFYEGKAQNSLHIGYARPGYDAAVWGARGLTGGDASRNFSDPDARAFLQEFDGGKVGTNRDVAAVAGAGGRYGHNPDVSMAVIGQMETGGQSGDHYKVVVNPSAGNKAALGRYGILLGNVGPWAREAGLGEVSASQFLNDSGIQDKIFQFKFGQYVKKYGLLGAARAWFAGEGGMHSSSTDMFGTTPNSYEARFKELYAAGGGDTSTFGPGTGGETAGYTPEDNQRLEVVQYNQGEQQKQLNLDPMTYYHQETGTPLSMLDSDIGFDKRQEDYNTAKQMYELSGDQRKPLTSPEVTYLKNLMDSTGNDDIKAQIFARMARWTPEMQKEAYKQIEQQAPFGAAAGRLYADGDKPTALSAIHGNELLKTSKANGVKPAWEDDLDKANVEILANVLRGTPDTGLTSIGLGKTSLYKAIYADKYGLGDEFNQEAYEKIVEEVEHGEFGTVNGTRVLKPIGVEDGAFELAMPVLLGNPEFSVTQSVPLAKDTRTGEPAPAQPAALVDAHPIRVALDTYAFLDNAGQWFAAQTPQGLVRYKAVLTAKAINEAAAKITASPIQVGPQPQPTPLYTTGGPNVPPEGVDVTPIETVPAKSLKPVQEETYVAPLEDGKVPEFTPGSEAAYAEKFAATLRRSGMSEDRIKATVAEWLAMAKARASKGGQP